MVDRATALQWSYLPWSIGPPHCNGAIYHGRQGHRIAVELSTKNETSATFLTAPSRPEHLNFLNI